MNGPTSWRARASPPSAQAQSARCRWLRSSPRSCRNPCPSRYRPRRAILERPAAAAPDPADVHYGLGVPCELGGELGGELARPDEHTTNCLHTILSPAAPVPYCEVIDTDRRTPWRK